MIKGKLEWWLTQLTMRHANQLVQSLNHEKEVLFVNLEFWISNVFNSFCLTFSCCGSRRPFELKLQQAAMYYLPQVSIRVTNQNYPIPGAVFLMTNMSLLAWDPVCWKGFNGRLLCSSNGFSCHSWVQHTEGHPYWTDNSTVCAMFECQFVCYPSLPYLSLFSLLSLSDFALFVSLPVCVWCTILMRCPSPGGEGSFTEITVTWSSLRDAL